MQQLNDGLPITEVTGYVAYALNEFETLGWLDKKGIK